MEQKNLTYEAAYNELKRIAAEIETSSVSVDVLAERVKRAAELTKYCQDKLRSVESEVNKVISELEKSVNAGSAQKKGLE